MVVKFCELGMRQALNFFLVDISCCVFSLVIWNFSVLSVNKTVGTLARRRSTSKASA